MTAGLRTSSPSSCRDGFERLSLQEEVLEATDVLVEAPGSPRYRRLLWAGPALATVGAIGLVVVLTGGRKGKAGLESRFGVSTHDVVGFQEEPFTCAKYGCLDVKSPANPCGCSDKCVQDGNCCADYQASCAAFTPLTNPLLDKWQGCGGAADPPMTPGVWQYAPSGLPLPVKIMSYNAEWWHVIEQMGGNGNSIGQTIVNAEAPEPIDVIGMQEFYDPWFGFARPGFDAGALLTEYQWMRGEVGSPVGQIIGYRKSVWSLINRGQKYVAKDLKGEWDYGERSVFWVRLYHLQTGKTMLVANHHGPLPVNTGGVCGGPTTASNILAAIAEGAQPGDAIVVVGDFNADGSSQTYAGLSRYLHRNFEGLDNIWTNLPEGSMNQPMQVGGGGSDHQAVTVVLNLPGAAAAA